MEIHGCSRNFWNRWQNIVTWDVSHHFIKYHISWRKGEREKNKKERERNICQWTTFYAFISLFTIFFMFLASPRSSSSFSRSFVCLILGKCSKAFFLSSTCEYYFFIVKIMGCIFLFVFYSSKFLIRMTV